MPPSIKQWVQAKGQSADSFAKLRALSVEEAE